MKSALTITLFLASVICLTSVSAPSMDLGDNKFAFIGYLSKAPVKADYEITVANRDEKYKLSATKLKNHAELMASLAKVAASDNPDARFSGTWLFANNKKEIDPATLKVEPIKGAKDCPDKTYSRHNITGTFMGTECGDFCYTTVKGPDGKEFTMYGDTEGIFGTKPGIKVSIDYEVAQTWLDTGDWGMCVIDYMFISGKKLK